MNIMGKNHLCRDIFMFLGWREIDGVGRDNPKLFGFQVSFPPYYFVLFLGDIVSEVFFSIYYGNLHKGSPCPLLAGLKAASWGNRFMLVLALVLFDCKICLALASSPYVNKSLTNGLSPWLMVLYVAYGNFLLNSCLYLFSCYFFRSYGSGTCFNGLKNYVSTLLIGFVVKFLA